MKKVRRVANFRLPFAAALALSGGVALAYVCALCSVDYLWLLAAAPVAAAVFIAVDLFARSAQNIVCCAVVIAFFAAGAVYGAAVFASWSSPPVLSGEVASVTGVVEEVRYTASGRPYLILSSATADGVALDGKLIAYLSDEAGGAVRAGYRVRAFGYVGHYDLISYGGINYRSVGGVKYFADCYGSIEYEYGFSLFSYVRLGIYSMLCGNLEEEAAAVAYAMITGSTQDISMRTLESFRYGGVSHIFAVSGLNITLLYGALSLIFRAVRLNKWASAAVSLAVVFFYTGMCGFTLSAVRAAIMCAVVALTSLSYRKYDGLNSLSLAVIIIVLVDPLNLFDVGFVLSVSAMLGIIFLAPGLRRALSALPAWLKNNISLSVASQVATLPALLATFGYISGAGLILNIVVLPLLSALYILLFACVVACAVIPPMATAVLPAASMPLEAVTNFFVSSGFENSLLSGFGGWWISLFIFGIVAVLSDKFNFARPFRAAASVVLAGCTAMLFVAEGAVFGDETRVVAGGAYDGGMVLLRSRSGTALVLIDGTYEGGLSTFVNTYAPGGVDDIILVGGDEAAEYWYGCGVEADDVWLPPGSLPVGAVDGAAVHNQSDFVLGGCVFRFADDYTLCITSNGVEMAICAGQYINIPRCDLMFTLEEVGREAAATVVCFNGSYSHFDLYSSGCLQFVLNDDTISMQSASVGRLRGRSA